MSVIQINIPLKWRLKNNHKYCFGIDKCCYNVQRGKKIKQSYNGGMIGYWIDKRFVSLKKLRKEIELIPKEKLPF